MKQKTLKKIEPDCSSIHVDIRIEEVWIDQYVSEAQVVIPVNDQYTLAQLQFGLSQGNLTLTGEIQEKPGSLIEMTCTPVWDVDQQQFKLIDLQLQTKSKNLMIKSAGWFAQVFLQNKIDSKIELAANQLYTHYLEKIKAKPLVFPFSNGGRAEATVMNVIINEMHFGEQVVEIKAAIEGNWKLSLEASVSNPSSSSQVVDDHHQSNGTVPFG